MRSPVRFREARGGIETILLLNGPDERPDAVMIRSGDRWPHRLPRRLTRQVPHAYPF